MKFLLTLAIGIIPFFASADWRFIDKTGDEVVLEEITSPDLSEEREVFIRSFGTAYSSFNEEDLGIINKTRFLNEAFESVEKDYAAQSMTLIAAKKNNKIIGIAGFKRAEEPGTAYVAQLAVDPQEWQKGIGRHLIFSILTLEPQITHLVAITRKINCISKNFFNHIGFTPSLYMHAGYDPNKYTGYEWR